MSVIIRDQHDLDRLNIHTAWQFADQMNAAAFDELCRVTMVQVSRDAARDVREGERVRDCGA